MKSKLLIFFFLCILFSCQEKKNSDKIENVDYSQETLDVTTSIYPDAIDKVFEAHGGIDQWNKMEALQFAMPKDQVSETTKTNLKTRESLIDLPSYSIGYDGKEVWLHKKDSAEYKGNPKFYYNLMFYFYAMPFVLADDGINYEETEPLNFEGNQYPGIKISYESGVGESPEDEYILYYNPETSQMEWLGYTVTYFTNEKSKEWHYINYSEWQEIEGFKLPKTLTWYKVEENQPTKLRNSQVFTEVQLMTEAFPDSIFQKPEGAEVVE